MKDWITKQISEILLMHDSHPLNNDSLVFSFHRQEIENITWKTTQKWFLTIETKNIFHIFRKKLFLFFSLFAYMEVKVNADKSSNKTPLLSHWKMEKSCLCLMWLRFKFRLV